MRMIRRLNGNDSLKALIHIAAWVFVFFLPFLLDAEKRGNHQLPEKDEQEFFNLYIKTFVSWIIIFYFNARVLVPRLFSKGKYLWYALAVLLLFLVHLGIHSIFFKLLIHSKPFVLMRSVRFNLSTFFLVITVSLVYWFLQDRTRREKNELRKQEENLRSELSFLRSQISPHFVFNVLNNIVAMVRLKSEETEDTLLKLSALLHYMLYESENEKVSLGREVEYLRGHMDLQLQRFGKNVSMHVAINIENEDAQIEPMLLIPFVENAFKHGTGLSDRGEIVVELEERDHELHFRIRNRFEQNQETSRDETPGIGLANVRRRLGLLYGGNHALDLDAMDGFFRVNLKLKLNS